MNLNFISLSHLVHRSKSSEILLMFDDLLRASITFIINQSYNILYVIVFQSHEEVMIILIKKEI